MEKQISQSFLQCHFLFAHLNLSQSCGSYSVLWWGEKLALGRKKNTVRTLQYAENAGSGI